MSEEGADKDPGNEQSLDPQPTDNEQTAQQDGQEQPVEVENMSGTEEPTSGEPVAEEAVVDEPPHVDSPEEEMQYEAEENQSEERQDEEGFSNDPPMAPPPAIATEEPFMEMQPMITQDIESLKSDDTAASREKKTAKPRSEGKPQPAQPTYPYRARKVDDKTIIAKLGKVPAKHTYFGYIYSSQSQRPPGYFHNYILPTRGQPSPRQHIQIVGAPVPEEKIHKMKDAPKKFMPLSAVKVRWGSGLRNTVYKPEDVYAYLSRFGPIDGVYSLTINSALVIFSDLEAARAAITCPYLGLPWDPLIATWVEPRMHNSGFYRKYANIEDPPIRMRT